MLSFLHYNGRRRAKIRLLLFPNTLKISLAPHRLDTSLSHWRPRAKIFAKSKPNAKIFGESVSRETRQKIDASKY
jgi:hypothetical protein